MQYDLFPEQYTFFSLSSGSCGNSYYLGNASHGILIDAGLGPRIIKKRLTEHGIDISSIFAVLITHDHYDHIKSVEHLGNKLNIPVYATHGVHKGIGKCPLIRNGINGSRKYIEKGKPFQIESFKITAFHVPHDSEDNAGYFIEFGNHRLMIATDVGEATDEIARYMSQANHIVIESNYDEELLLNGNYPMHLKVRISNGTGHLSNRQAAEFIAANYSERTKNIWLCHLSGDNNNPELAYETVAKRLAEAGICVKNDVSLGVFERNILSEKTIL